MGQPLAAPIFSIGNLPNGLEPDIGGNEWGDFRKGGTTRAIRIKGTFRVVTVHGGPPLVCHDGWLAIDSKGHPYPIEDEVFRATYVSAALRPGEPEPPAPPPDGWQGEPPAEGTRRKLVLDVIERAFDGATSPGPPNDVSSLDLADAIEAALLAVEPTQSAPVDPPPGGER